MILVGMQGSKANIPTTGAPIPLVDCRLIDLDHRDKLKIPLEDPGEVVLHFASTVAATFFPVRLEWGAFGGSNIIEIPAYNGLSIPLKGSWFRASVIPFTGFTGPVGCHAAIGRVEAPIVCVLGPTSIAAATAASVSLGTGITAGGVALPIRPLIGFVSEIQIMRFPQTAFFASGLSGSPFNFWQVNCAQDASCPWVPTAGCFSPVAPNDQFDIQNNGVVAAEFSAFAKLSL